MTISVIIPTFQAEHHLPALFSILGCQDLPVDEIIVIDSSSTDATCQISREAGCRVLTISQQEFRHGRARNLAASNAVGDILVFLTQDALPVDSSFLSQLTQPILQGHAAAVTARQIAYPQANPLEKFAREFNYPLHSFLRSLEDVKTLGIKAYFFSDSASAIQREAFWKMGGFSENVLVNEDMFLCSTLLRAGHSVAYQAEARVFHSHEYPFKRLFQRYFDIGVFFRQAGSALQGGNTGGEGLRFVIQAVNALTKSGNWLWIPRLFAETAIKFLAFQIGKRYQWLPLGLARRFSGQPYFWEVSHHTRESML